MYVVVNYYGSRKESSFKNYEQLKSAINTLSHKFTHKFVSIHCYDIEEEYQKYYNSCRDLIQSGNKHPTISKLRNTKRLLNNYNKHLTLLESYRQYFLIVREPITELGYDLLINTLPEYRIFRFIKMYTNKSIKSPIIYKDPRINNYINIDTPYCTEHILFPKTWDFTQLNMYFTLQTKETMRLRICK